MRIEVYRATRFRDVPAIVNLTFDGLDDRYLAAFDNYPDAVKLVVIGWGTTGEVKGRPLAVLVATEGHIITGYVDTYFDAEVDDDPDDDGEPYVPNVTSQVKKVLEPKTGANGRTKKRPQPRPGGGVPENTGRPVRRKYLAVSDQSQETGATIACR